jgi:hypothetical protein
MWLLSFIAILKGDERRICRSPSQQKTAVGITCHGSVKIPQNLIVKIITCELSQDDLDRCRSI